MFGRKRTAILLDKAFDPKTLESGDYIVLSSSEAYLIVAAMVADGDAKWLGERQEPGGVLASLVRVRSKVKNNLRRNRDVYVTYSADAFTKILRDYAGWREKWWRECIQNAVDAGATEIKLTAQPTDRNTMICSCEDNGKGMTEDILEHKFLKLGGTTKDDEDSETAGGFGEAKKLLILPWLNWEIVTNDVIAKGVGDKGDIGKAPQPIKGTRLRVEMSADECTDAIIAMAYVQKCYLPNIKFTIDGEEVKADFLAGKFVFKIGRKATVSHNEFSGVPSMMVRVKGMFMFDSRLPGVEGTVVVELNRPSIELLTSNRDGFRDYELTEAIDVFRAQVSADTRSALHEKKEIEKHKFKGIGNAEHEERVLSVLAAMPPLPPIEPGMHVAFDGKLVGPVIKQFEVTDAANDLGLCEGVAKVILTSTNIIGQAKLERLVRTMAWNPDILIANEKGEDYSAIIGDRFVPATMTDKIKRLLRVWTELCRYVLIQLDCNDPFNVGFVFSDRATAMFMRWAGQDYLLLNPIHDAGAGYLEPSKVDDLRWIYALAVHEATHMADNVIRHDESFSSAVTRNMAKCTDGFCHAQAIVAAIDAAKRAPSVKGVAGEQLEIAFASPDATKIYNALLKVLVKRLDDLGAESFVYEEHSEKLAKSIQQMDITAPAFIVVDLPRVFQGNSAQEIARDFEEAFEAFSDPEYDMTNAAVWGWDGKRLVELGNEKARDVFIQRQWRSVEVAEDLGLPPGADWTDAHQVFYEELLKVSKPYDMTKKEFKKALVVEIVALNANEPAVVMISGRKGVVAFQHYDRDEMSALIKGNAGYFSHPSFYGWTGGESGELKPLDSHGDLASFLMKNWKFSSKELTDLLAHRLSQVKSLPGMSEQEWENKTEKMAKAINAKRAALFFRSDTRADLLQFNDRSELVEKLEFISEGANAELYGWEPVEGKVDGYLYELSQARDYEAFLNKHWTDVPKPQKGMPHFNALVAESERVGWPESFKTDLSEHDRETLSHYSPRLPFVWLLRAHGTHLMLTKDRNTPQGIYDFVISMGITTAKRKDKDHLWYGWDGQGTLHSLDNDTRLEMFLAQFWPK